MVLRRHWSYQSEPVGSHSNQYAYWGIFCVTACGSSIPYPLLMLMVCITTSWYPRLPRPAAQRPPKAFNNVTNPGTLSLLLPDHGLAVCDSQWGRHEVRASRRELGRGMEYILCADHQPKMNWQRQRLLTFGILLDDEREWSKEHLLNCRECCWFLRYDEPKKQPFQHQTMSAVGGSKCILEADMSSKLIRSMIKLSGFF
jgi:hypothetical protein